MIPNLLSQMIFMPLLMAVVLLLIPRKYERVFYYLGCLATVATFGVSLHLVSDFLPQESGYQFQEIYPWIETFGIAYYVGLDGISLILSLLTTLLTMVALFSIYRAVKTRRKEFVISILVLETAMLGTFAALDTVLFYVFWEAMLIPMYFLIGIYGGPRRVYATLKFFVYTMAGSVLMLIGFLVLYSLHISQFGFASTAIEDLLRLSVPVDMQTWLFLLFVIAFAIKVPVFPFHTWLPDAHVEAPTAGSVILAGVLLKMGGYGLIRIAIPMFPSAAVAFSPLMGLIGVIGIIYGAYVALSQEDMKRLVAYSSVSHMGFVVLGLSSLSPVAVTGAVFQMVAHGLSTGALFLLVGMLYERRHTRMLADYGGLAQVTPKLAGVFFIVTLASIGMPGLCGFVGEFLILTGSFHSLILMHPAWLVGFAIVGIVLGATYMLVLFEKVFWGKVRHEENQSLQDLKWSEGLVLLLPVLLAIVLGLKPGFVLDRIHPAVDQLVETVKVEAGLLTERGRIK